MPTIAQLFSGITPPPPDAPRSLRELFEQGKWWKGAEGWIRVKDMTPAHRLNVARLLIRNAADYAEQMAWSTHAALVGLNAPEEVVDDMFREMEERDAEPTAWMCKTKLYRKITKKIKIDASPTNFR
jgi:hypothetical protein